MPAINRFHFILDLAKNVCKEVRQALDLYKSGTAAMCNSPEDVARLSTASQRVNGLRPTIHAGYMDWFESKSPTPYPANVVSCITDAQAGNCQEHAILAYDKLSKFPLGTALEVMGSKEKDHVFVVVGRRRKKMPSAEVNFAAPSPFQLISNQWNDEVKTADWNFKLWNKEAIVCDPWANVVCWANHYPERLAAEMRRWHLRNISISEIVNGRGVPTSPMKLTLGFSGAPLRIQAVEFVPDFGGAQLAVREGMSVSVAAEEFLITNPGHLAALENLRTAYLISPSRVWSLKNLT